MTIAHAVKATADTRDIGGVGGGSGAIACQNIKIRAGSANSGQENGFDLNVIERCTEKLRKPKQCQLKKAQIISRGVNDVCKHEVVTTLFFNFVLFQTLSGRLMMEALKSFKTAL